MTPSWNVSLQLDPVGWRLLLARQIEEGMTQAGPSIDGVSTRSVSLLASRDIYRWAPPPRWKLVFKYVHFPPDSASGIW